MSGDRPSMSSPFPNSPAPNQGTTTIPVLTSGPELTETQQTALLQLREGLRPAQQVVADWCGGPLAVSAVPGAGKSTGMAGAAAILIARERLHSQRQLIVVTFTRSAAANLKLKIRTALQHLSLPPAGFSVFTLHALALNIATRHPELSGFNLDEMSLVSPNQGHRLIRTAVDQWIGDNPRLYQRLVEGLQFDGEETESLRRQSVLRTEVLPALAQTVIHEAKSSGYGPQDLWALHQRAEEQRLTDPYPILAIAAGLYDHYQRLLQQRQLVDYDEMILAAIRVLKNEMTRELWQRQVFAVFEDEAQDSSPLQTHLLELLAVTPDAGIGSQRAGGELGDRLNLVRVGDPNQAINSTFTPADPIYFRQFCEQCEQGDRLVTMDQAGRSSPIIIDAANFVLNWVNESRLAGNEQPFRNQIIRPVDPNDPQPNANPEPLGLGLEIHRPKDIFQTVERITERLQTIFADNPSAQVAILVRENRQGSFLASELQVFADQGIVIYEVGRSDRHSHVPGEMLALLQFMNRPHSPDYLKAALKVFLDRQLIAPQDLNRLAAVPELFLYPGPLDPPTPEPMAIAARYCRSLLRARLELPPYQLIPFLSFTLQYDQTELATADKLAARIAQQNKGDRTVALLLENLGEIVSTEQFEPVDTDKGEERYTRGGQITLITLHKAKGLDWDYVFMPFLFEQSIPGQLRVPASSQFLGDFTLAEVTRAQIRASLHGRPSLPDVQMAWKQAGDLKSAEEFRLLYVGMTRAKRLLWMSAAQEGPFSWSKLENLDKKAPCPVIPALQKRFPQSVFPTDPSGKSPNREPGKTIQELKPSRA